jgi:hypothetical protein
MIIKSLILRETMQKMFFTQCIVFFFILCFVMLICISVSGALVSSCWFDEPTLSKLWLASLNIWMISITAFIPSQLCAISICFFVKVSALIFLYFIHTTHIEHVLERSVLFLKPGYTQKIQESVLELLSAKGFVVIAKSGRVRPLTLYLPEVFRLTGTHRGAMSAAIPRPRRREIQFQGNLISSCG